MYGLKPEQKLLHLEFLRVFAIILVVYNHAGTFVIPKDELCTLAEWAVCFGSTSCKVAVPLFFMISGALLLGREEDLKTLYRKRVWRFAVVIFGFNALQYVVRGLSGNYVGHACVSWFLYAYLMVLVFLPFLRKLAGGMKSMDFFYLLAICLVVEVLLKIPYFQLKGDIFFIVKHTPFMPLAESVPFTAGYGAFYMLMGFWAERFLSGKMYSAGFRWGIAVMSVACLMISTVILSIVQSEQLMGCFLPIPSLTVYLWVKYVFSQIKLPSRAVNIHCQLGGAVIVVMLTENIWRALVANFILPQVYEVGTSWFIHLAHVLLACLFAILLGMLFKLIPGVRKYI